MTRYATYQPLMPKIIQAGRMGERDRLAQEARDRREMASRVAAEEVGRLIPEVSDERLKSSLSALSTGVESGAIDPASAYSNASRILESDRAMTEQAQTRQANADLVRGYGLGLTPKAEDFTTSPLSLMPQSGQKPIRKVRNPTQPQPPGIVNASPLSSTRAARDNYLDALDVADTSVQFADAVEHGASPDVAISLLKNQQSRVDARQKENKDTDKARDKRGFDALTKKEEAKASWTGKVDMKARVVVLTNKAGDVRTVPYKGQDLEGWDPNDVQIYITQPTKPGEKGKVTAINKRTMGIKVHDVDLPVKASGAGRGMTPVDRADAIRKARDLMDKGNMRGAEDLLIANKFSDVDRDRVIRDGITPRSAAAVLKTVLSEYGGGDPIDTGNGLPGVMAFTSSGKAAMRTLERRYSDVLSGKIRSETERGARIIADFNAVIRARQAILGSLTPPRSDPSVAAYDRNGNRITEVPRVQQQSSPPRTPGVLFPSHGAPGRAPHMVQ